MRVVLSVTEDDSDDLYVDELARQLRLRLLEADDVESVVPLDAGDVPEGARSVFAETAGVLLTAVAPLGLAGLVGVAQEWARTAIPRHRSVRLEIDGDVLVLGGISREKQDQMIADWVKRHEKTGRP